MLREIFKEKHLPINDLENIGLADKGKLLMDVNDLQALLSGRRTGMISLKNLSSNGLNIEQLDAKLSMKPNAKGKLDLLIHPIYKEASYPPFLTDVEAQKLQNGESLNINKTIPDGLGNKNEILVEFDKDTKEFVITDTEKIIIPDLVNNEKLTTEQKERYRKGKMVELKDGTIFQMSNTTSNGIISNKTALIVSLLLDGGVTYLLMKGLNALSGKKPDEVQSRDYGKGYEKAFKDMQAQLTVDKKRDNDVNIERAKSSEYSRGYNRSGTSR